MPSAGLLEQARRGRYRAKPPVVPVPEGVDQLQSQLTLAQLDPADFQSDERIPDPPAALDRRTAAARVDAAHREATADQNSVRPRITAAAAAGQHSLDPRQVTQSATQGSDAAIDHAPIANSAATPRFGGFRIPGMEGIMRDGGSTRQPIGQERSQSLRRAHQTAPAEREAGQATNLSPAMAQAVVAAPVGARHASENSQVIADRHAAGVLVRLVSAVVEGGGGRQARVGEPSRQTLATLIAEAHRVSRDLTAAAAGGTQVRRSLQATMLKETAYALARHYSNTGEVAADSFRAIAQSVLDAGADLVPQEILDLLGQASPDYGSVESERQYAEDRLRAASFDIAWEVQRSLQDSKLHYGRFFDLRDGDPDADRPFTYGQPLDAVRGSLLQAVRRIVDAAHPDIKSPLILAKWREGALSRASKLLCAIYRTETVRLLRAEATPDLLGRARANALGGTFASVMAGVERKAREQFNEIERSAPELMRLGEPLQESMPEASRQQAHPAERERS